MRKLLVITIVGLVFFIIAGCSNTSEINSINNTVDWNRYKTQDDGVSYKILTTTVMDRSNYERDRHRVLLGQDISNQNIDETTYYIIKKLIKDDPSLDEIILWFHSEEDGVDGPYDLGSAIWAHRGELGSVLDYNINTDSRKGYKIKFSVKDNIAEYMTTKFDDKDVGGLSVEDRRQVYIDLVTIEDKATSEADAKYNFYDILNQDEFTKVSKMNGEYYDKKLAEYRLGLIEKWSITTEQLDGISSEGLMKTWPLE